MNRKPRPSAEKYTTGRSSPDRSGRTRATSGTASTSSAIAAACASTARLTSGPISACGRISSRSMMVPSRASRSTA